MSNTRTTAQLAVPPPRQDIGHLSDGTGPVGWIGDDRLGFTGFATLGEAANAAWVAHVALERRRAKSRGEAAPHIEPELELWVSGNDEWLTVNGKRVARLLSPSSTLPAGGDSWFGFEVVFTPDTSSFEIESHAHVVYRGLRRSGVRWPMRTTQRPPGATCTTGQPLLGLASSNCEKRKNLKLPEKARKKAFAVPGRFGGSFGQFRSSKVDASTV